MGRNASVILDSWAIPRIAPSITVPVTHAVTAERARVIKTDTTVPAHPNGKVGETDGTLAEVYLTIPILPRLTRLIDLIPNSVSQRSRG